MIEIEIFKARKDALGFDLRGDEISGEWLFAGVHTRDKFFYHARFQCIEGIWQEIDTFIDVARAHEGWKWVKTYSSLEDFLADNFTEFL